MRVVTGNCNNGPVKFAINTHENMYVFYNGAYAKCADFTRVGHLRKYAYVVWRGFLLCIKEQATFHCIKLLNDN